MSICPKNKSSKARRDSRRANWKMSAPTLVKCSKLNRRFIPAVFFIDAGISIVCRRECILRKTFGYFTKKTHKNIQKTIEV